MLTRARALSGVCVICATSTENHSKEHAHVSSSGNRECVCMLVCVRVYMRAHVTQRAVFGGILPGCGRLHWWQHEINQRFARAHATGALRTDARDGQACVHDLAYPI